jgi:hypothetical protein
MKKGNWGNTTAREVRSLLLKNDDEDAKYREPPHDNRTHLDNEIFFYGFDF